GISLALLALWGGGVLMQVGPRYDLPGYIGVDWFILDLLVSTMIFIFLEKLFPHIREQAILRPDWRHDFRYFALNHLLIGIFAFVATMTAADVVSSAVNTTFRSSHPRYRGPFSPSWPSSSPISSSMRFIEPC